MKIMKPVEKDPKKMNNNPSVLPPESVFKTTFVSAEPHFTTVEVSEKKTNRRNLLRKFLLILNFLDMFSTEFLKF